MKKIKLSLMVIALVAICSAFATSANVNGLTTYYPVSNGSGGWTWETSTADLSCRSGSIGCAGFDAGSQPPANSTPDGYTVTSEVWRP